METCGSSLPKIVGVGFHKTGTKTLAECLRILGYRHQSLSRHDFDLWLQGKREEILATMEKADSFDDWPWPLLSLQASIRFHKSRFVLTTRSTEQRFFACEPNRLLEICWENGDGWQQLCAFLGCPVPTMPLPHCNAAPAQL